ncbi:MAG: FAD-dependent oxidoreductase [Chloroflexota bacterium]
MPRSVAVVGASVAAVQAALTLAELGVQVTLVTPSTALGVDSANGNASAAAGERLTLWPLLLKAATHPLVTLHTGCETESIIGRQGRFTVRATRRARYVREDLCTGCGRCIEACSVQLPLLPSGERLMHTAIHAPVLGQKTVPSAYYVEKTGIAPCRTACPLGINVQGFVSLLSKGKVDQALNLITDVAPLPAVLGRVCTHPCEEACKRGEIDDPVFIQALHRYAADNAPSGINYRRKVPSSARRERVAIVGSGPAGLAAAWDLARRGYRPTIFEAHAVVGGMLATGIPRFRLPREVREREIEAIRALGVDMKTGVRVGHDVTMNDLRERGYRAFFLAIGAHENRPLNIPGEDLDGIVDGMALLFALNLRVGTSVGSNVVIVGGGNSAVDAARTANRRSKGTVRILCIWDRMTAVKEDVEDAVKEGVVIEYSTAAAEILGDDGKVAAVRCQRTQGGDLSPENFCLPEPIPGTDFTVDADQVVVSIGQRPSTSVLRMSSLTINENGTIGVDPLTLATRVPGVFAGGDCVTGSNNVVQGVAAGLRAAKSIDRYLRGRDLRRDRSLEPPEAVDIDPRERDVSYHKRARMPGIPISKRAGNFEETARGLPGDVVEREAARCLNCARCSECLECERVCEQGAVMHQDTTQRVDIPADVVLDFHGGGNGTSGSLSRLDGDCEGPLSMTGPGIYRVTIEEDLDLESELAQATAAALRVAADLGPKESPQPAEPDVGRVTATGSAGVHGLGQSTPDAEARVGVVLCRCGGSIDAVVDFNQVTNDVLRLPGVYIVQEIGQACTEEGAKRIAAQVAEWNLNKVVLAACRCCGLEQICFSCTDRRVMCQQHLSKQLPLDCGKDVDYVNIREQCAWVHADDPAGATRKATDMVSAAVARVTHGSPGARTEYAVAPSVLILGSGIRGLSVAKCLATQGYAVDIVSGPEADRTGQRADVEYLDARNALLKELEESGVHVRSWPHALGLDGCPGSYEAVLDYEPEASRINAGALVVNPGGLPGEISNQGDVISETSRLGRILSRNRYRDGAGGDAPLTLKAPMMEETAGVFIVSGNERDPAPEQAVQGMTVASKALAYMSQGTRRSRGAAVTIDSALCRGCGDCAAVCPLIEIRQTDDGLACAHVDPGLCLGCGACIAHCPTGAIAQPYQGNRQIAATLEALWQPAPRLVEVK